MQPSYSIIDKCSLLYVILAHFKQHFELEALILYQYHTELWLLDVYHVVALSSHLQHHLLLHEHSFRSHLEDIYPEPHL
jgi:hypothetical protein